MTHGAGADREASSECSLRMLQALKHGGYSVFAGVGAALNRSLSSV